MHETQTNKTIQLVHSYHKIFYDLEEGALKALQNEGLGKPPVYPVGPLVQAGSSEGLERSECLQWLDGQPSESVVFVSFGSGGTLSQDQLNELALGLERSGQRFLWVVRSPNDKSANAAYFNAQSQNDPLSFLPKVMLTEGLKVSLRPKSDESGLVGREEIAEVLKSLMEGEDGKKVRQRMDGLKDAAAKVLSEDGSSAKSLSDLAFKWKNYKNI
ncbi:Hydroquinone glucosyltransferase [Camellia lanceoleosa]|uniref:Hydroquinone glucosyltransferase n=1 Tax=Camellia lanceoleosa TaxID=1840588 RepID=A0ACC0IQ96_9ERIC|nr:Hydroquinone glucosyltransferase [Camellia lanceoleosa]